MMNMKKKKKKLVEIKTWFAYPLFD
jgi:hypothetical protein